MTSGYFVTGTDTECGKTLVTLGMMHRYKTTGYRVAGMKPVASGSRPTPRGLRNEDAVHIQHQASDMVDYGLINPYAFEPAIAPHLAASAAGIRLQIDVIEACYRQLAEASDRVLVEGVGGWRVPLGEDWGVAELARALGLPVILVVDQIGLHQSWAVECGIHPGFGLPVGGMGGQSCRSGNARARG